MGRTFKIHSREELMKAPDPRFLVDQILPERSLAVLVGSPGVGKTFIALDISLCISTDQSWLGNETLTGNVIYITSEGLNGLKLRVQAWESQNKIEVRNFGYVDQAPQFIHDDEIEDLIEDIRLSTIKNPCLIVIDTLARHMVGGDENSALHMGEFIANVDKLRTAFNCAVLVVHHTGKRINNSSFNERGSSALRGAADTMLLVNKDKNGISIRCEKQKDSEPFEEIPILLKTVALLNGNSSCVIVRDENVLISSDKLDIEKEKILSELLDKKEVGLKTKEIIESTKIPPSSYYRHRLHLAKYGFITQGNQQRYFLTQKGEEYALTLKTLPKNSQESFNNTTITSTPL